MCVCVYVCVWWVGGGAGLQKVVFVVQLRMERRKEANVLFNDALSTFYLRLYDIEHRTHCRHHMGERDVAP